VHKFNPFFNGSDLIIRHVAIISPFQQGKCLLGDIVPMYPVTVLAAPHPAPVARGYVRAKRLIEAGIERTEAVGAILPLEMARVVVARRIAPNDTAL